MKHLSIFMRALAFAAICVFMFAAPLRAEQAMRLPLDGTALVIDTGNGLESFDIEVADDTIERSRGLMFRKDMPDNRGMLFVFPAQQFLSFWMKNTVLPLDLVFIDEDGIVRDVLPGVPFSEDSISPDEPTQYVLELKRGTAARLGIDAGDKVMHPLIGEQSMIRPE